MADLKRIMIIGQPGSGKSTLARRLGEITDLPVVHIDHIHWQSGWIDRTKAEKDVLCAQVHAGDKWIFEGGHSRSWTERMERADMVIVLDLPLSLRAWRVFWRVIEYNGRTRPDLPEGCPARFNWEFTAWIWNTRNTGHALMRKALQNAPDDTIKVHLTSRRGVAKFVKEFQLKHQ
jgi:adenylate kinase family enzyme